MKTKRTTKADPVKPEPKPAESSTKVHPSDVERETILTALHAIVEGNHGLLNPRLVIDAARHPGHVLHAHFEWDDRVAGEAYRLAQVGALIRRVRFPVVRIAEDTRTISISTTRGFQSRPGMRTASGGYERIDAILRDEQKRSELLAAVVRELMAYRKRYAELSELQAVWIAVDDLAVEVSPSAPDGEARPGAAG